MSATRKVKRRKQLRALSLLEILVVTVILAIVISFSMAALNRFRHVADKTSCVSNLQQVGAAVALYVADNDGLLPGPNRGNTIFPTYRWRPGMSEDMRLTFWDYLYPYLGLPEPPPNEQLIANVGVCPAVARLAPDERWLRESKYFRLNLWNDPDLPVRYPNQEGFNNANRPFGRDDGWDDTWDRRLPARASQILNPSLLAVIKDHWGNVGGDGWHRRGPQRYNHNGAFNVLYLDGHVESVRPD